MSVLIRFCLIESFNFKVGKGNVLMRNLKVLVGTDYFLNRLELTFHLFLHLTGNMSQHDHHTIDFFIKCFLN
jgi:hypothetical protein